MPFYIWCSIAVADTSCSLVWISNVRHLKHHGIISFTTGYWYHWYPSTIPHDLKLHSLAWESDRRVSATQAYCSIIFIPDLNEQPQKNSKKRKRVVDRCVHSLVICSVPVALNVSLNTIHCTFIVIVISCAETAARYSHITRHLLLVFISPWRKDNPVTLSQCR